MSAPPYALVVVASVSLAASIACNGREISPDDCYAIQSGDICDLAPTVVTEDGRRGRCEWRPGRRIEHDDAVSGLSCTVAARGVCAAVITNPDAPCSAPSDYCTNGNESTQMHWWRSSDDALMFEVECGDEVVGSRHGQCGDGSEVDDRHCACICE